MTEIKSKLHGNNAIINVSNQYFVQPTCAAMKDEVCFGKDHKGPENNTGEQHSRQRLSNVIVQ